MKNARIVKIAVASGILAVMTATGHAAEKTKPYPHYWMSAATANQSIPGMSSEMSAIAGLFGGKKAFGPRRDLLLQVESPQPAAGAPQASHGIPPRVEHGGCTAPGDAKG